MTMGAEKITSPNMGLDIPVQNATTSPFWESYITNSLDKIDAHDHSPGSGAVLTQGSIQVVDDFSFRDYGLTKVNFTQYTNPTTYAATPGNATTYFMNGDYYIKDGSGNAIQLTIGGGLNASLVGGFTGDYAASGAYAVFVQADNEYRFFLSNHVMSRTVSGSVEIRSRTLNKDLYGIRLETSGNIASTYTWMLPDTQAPANSFLWVNSSGVVAYATKAPYDALVALLSDSAPNAFAPIMRSSAGVVVSAAQTDAIMLPKGTEAQRPIGVTGLLRFNTDSSSFEAFVDGDWGSVSGSTSISDWTQNTNYRLGNIVTYLGVQWRVTVKHTSSTTFDLSKVASFENGVKLINSAGHGLAVLDVVRYNETAWVKAQADAEEHLSDPPAVIWMVQGDYFVVVDVSRDLYIASHGLTDDTYFLSEDTAGELAAESPVISNPIIGVLDANNLHLLNYRPTVVGTEVSFGEISTAEDVDVTGRADGDTLIWNSTTEKYETGPGVQEAPNDGKSYVRKNEAWSEISSPAKVVMNADGSVSIGDAVFVLDVLSISGTVITAGTPVVFGSASTYYISVAMLESSKAIVTYTDDGNSYYGTACVLSISGTVITAGTPVVFESANTNYISVAMLESSKAIVTYRDDGNSSYGTARVLSTQSVDGVATSAATNAPVDVVFSGVAEGLSGLSTGKMYYLAANGSKTTSSTSIRIGKAISTTQLLLKLQ
jgi:hypothetical protein